MNLWTLVKSDRTLGAIYHVGRHRYIIPMIKPHNVTSLLDAYHREKCQKAHMENEFTSFSADHSCFGIHENCLMPS